MAPNRSKMDIIMFPNDAEASLDDQQSDEEGNGAAGGILASTTGAATNMARGGGFTVAQYSLNTARFGQNNHFIRTEELLPLISSPVLTTSCSDSGRYIQASYNGGHDDSSNHHPQYAPFKRRIDHQTPLSLFRGTPNGAEDAFVRRRRDGGGDDEGQQQKPLLLPEVQPWRWENVAIPGCYFVVGLVQGLSRPLINVYPLDLGATEAQQLTLLSLPILPSTLKLAFGFLSDVLPLCGYRRKIYMTLGWLLASGSMIALWLSSDVHLVKKFTVSSSRPTEEYDYDDEIQEDDDDDIVSYEYNREHHHPHSFAQKSSVVFALVQKSDTQSIVTIPPPGAPSIPLLGLCFLAMSVGYWFADVMGDALVAEKTRFEPSDAKGRLQSTCYACRFFALMAAAPISTFLYSTYGPQSVIFLLIVAPLCMLPLIVCLKETRLYRNVVTTSLSEKGRPNVVMEHCREIWNTVCSRAVWQPMGFVYIFNVLNVTNAAWKQYLKTVLHFTSEQLNMLLVISYALLFGGILVYKEFMMNWSWRSVYLISIILNAIVSAMQILLIRGQTFGLSPFVFALGDDGIVEFMTGIQFLPLTIIMVHLVPEGSEGASYALFTSVWNAGMMVAPSLSTLLLSVWDVSRRTLAAGDTSGLTKLTLLTTGLQLSTILFLWMLPRTRQDLDRLHSMTESRSRIGGTLVLGVVFSSILYSTYVSVLNLVRPEWAGGS